MRRIVTTGAILLMLGGCARGAADQAQVEQIVHDYILAHPEIVPEAMEALRQKEAGKAIAADRAAIEKPFAGGWAGSADPKVTLVMFTDYACGYCRASTPEVARLLSEYPDLRVVWREIPVLGPESETAARLALAAARHGRYLPVHQGIFAEGRPDSTTLMKVAAHAGLDPAALVKEAGGADIAGEIQSNLKLAGRLGVSGTPAFVIGDRFLSGAVGYEALKAAIDHSRTG